MTNTEIKDAITYTKKLIDTIEESNAALRDTLSTDCGDGYGSWGDDGVYVLEPVRG